MAKMLPRFYSNDMISIRPQVINIRSPTSSVLYSSVPFRSLNRRFQDESQLRPLTGLPSEQARLVWNRAAETAGSGRITARLVGAALKELHAKPPGMKTPQKPARRSGPP